MSPNTSPGFTRTQVEQLLKPIKPHRVLHAHGQSHVPAYDVAAHLTRLFGFGGWQKEILDLTLVSEREAQTKADRPAYAVTYRCLMRLTVKDPSGNVALVVEDGACGSWLHPEFGEAHDMAMKSAISYALKRCAAFGLGDQFGLSLYNKGATAALVGQTLVMPPSDDAATPAPATGHGDLERHAPVPQSMGNDETQGDEADDQPVAAAQVPEAPTSPHVPAQGVLGLPPREAFARVLLAVGDNHDRAKAVWAAAGLPMSGAISVADVDAAIAAATGDPLANYTPAQVA